MAYEPEKDVTIKTLLDGGEDDVSVDVKKYGDGPEKIQISRMISGRFAKLGRLTIDEAEEVADAILTYVKGG